MSSIPNRAVPDGKQLWARPLLATLAELTMTNITIGELEASSRGLLLSGFRAAVPSGISIDSRTLRHGDLFFAIRGPANDGHNYIMAALSKGAMGVVVDSRSVTPANFPRDRVLLQVEDTHRALKDLAAEVRRQWTGSLIGITGSMGKTTTKEFAAHILQSEYGVYRSPGNYNNLFGLPLAIFGLSPDDQIGIFEMGMSAPGEIAEMCRIASPDVGVITNVAPVHLAFFKSVEEIALAKGELAQGLRPGGTLIYNADDPLVQKIAAAYAGNKISYGRSAEAEVRADEVETIGLQETRFRLSFAGHGGRAMIPLSGLHYIMNALPAVALGNLYGMRREQIVESLRDLHQAPMRGQVVRFAERFTVIDDSYNSNPQALMEMIKVLSGAPGSRRILVAGEMLELGADAGLLHFRCGQWAAQHGIDIVVAVRGDAKELAQGAVAGGIPESQVHFFTEVDPASDFVTRNVRSGDLVLVKGSRGVHLERLVQALRSQHAEYIL